MHTLRTFREHYGLQQFDISRKTDILPYQLSQIETNAVVPTIDQVLKIERACGEQLIWDEPLTRDQKSYVLNSIIRLAQRLPLKSVLQLAATALRQEDIIPTMQHYVERLDPIEPLLPNNI